MYPSSGSGSQTKFKLERTGLIGIKKTGRELEITQNQGPLLRIHTQENRWIRFGKTRILQGPVSPRAHPVTGKAILPQGTERPVAAAIHSSLIFKPPVPAQHGLCSMRDG